MDTKEILYVVENEFKQELAQSLGTVKVSNGDKEKTIVKVNEETPKKEKTKKKKDKGKEKKKPVKKVRKTNKENPPEQDGEETSVEKLARYNTYPDRVERLIIKDKEYIKFDFTDTPEIKSAKVCDIALSVIDGMGEEYDSEFNLKNNYEYIIDKATGEKRKIINNLIKDVKIVKGNVQIELKLKEKYNRALKFMYYVEV